MIQSFFSFIFTIFGTISFMISLLFVINFDFLFSLIMILPFFIKIPSSPFFYRLPEVHREATTSIPLSLAGITSKLSIYGIVRPILPCSFLSLRLLSSFIVSFTSVGIIIAFSSCFRYFDLKKIIAYSSILHPNSSLVSILSMNSSPLLSGIFISVSHGFSSISPSIIVGLLINKTYPRYLDCSLLINTQLRGLLLFFLPSNPSFPGTFNSTGEILRLIAIVSIDYFFSLMFLLSSFFSTFFRFMILNRKLPYFINWFSLGIIEFNITCLFIFTAITQTLSTAREV